MQKNQSIALFATALAIFIFNIEYFGVVIIVPAMTHTLKLTPNDIQWCLISYLMAYAVFIIVAGRLGDLYGNRMILMIGLALFAVASLIAGIAQNSWEMIFARFAQGFGGALIWPNITAIAFNSTTKKAKAFAMSIVTSSVGFSMAAGPVVAGFITSIWNWRLFFLINVPLAIIIMLIVMIWIKKPIKKSAIKINYKNLCLLILGLCCIILGISYIKHVSLYIIIPLLLVLLGAYIIKCYYKQEIQSKYPLITTSILQNIPFMTGCLLRSLVSGFWYVFLFIMALFLQSTLHYTAFKAGYLFLPMTLVIGLLSPFIGKYIQNNRAWKITTFGLILFITTYSLITIVYANSHPHLLITILILLLPGFAYATSYPGMLSTTMHTVDEKDSGVASGFFYMMSVLVSSVGISFATIILDWHHANVTTSFVPIMILCIVATIFSIILFITRTPRTI